MCVYVCLCVCVVLRMLPQQKLDHKIIRRAALLICKRIKRHVGATATQTFVFVTKHINHSGLFSAAQKLGTMAGKQR